MDFLEASGINALMIATLMLLLAWRSGNVIFSRLVREESGDPWESSIFSVGLGLGVISLGTFLFGALGLLYRWVFQILFVVGLAVSVPGLVRDFRSLWGNAKRPSSWLACPVIALLVGIAAVCLVAAIAPETGFDALNYHLGTPRLYMVHHRIVETDNLAGYSHPLAIDMLYLFAWLVHSSLAAKLIHFAFGIVTAAGCWLFCRRYVGPGSGPLAALLFLGTPIVMYLSQTAYADLGLALFALLAVFAGFRWLETRQRSWIVLAGIFSGLSLGAKYMGASVVAVIVAMVLISWFDNQRRRRMFADAALYAVVTGLVFAPWIIKNWVTTGNPFAPALANVIPTRGFTSPDYDRLVQLTRTWHGYSGSLLDWILIPWRQTFRPDIFHGDPGFAYLFLFPVAVVMGWRHRWLRLMAVCVAVGYGFLVIGTATTRFFAPVFPLISILIAGAIWLRAGSRRAWIRYVLVFVSLALVVVKLPWFSGLWPTPEPLILDTAKVHLFRTAAERGQFMEEKALGPGGNQLYRYLNELPATTRILALTPVYQALTDHEVFMPPNSTPSSEMADAAIELAKNVTGLADRELNISHPDLWSRFWKIQWWSDDRLTPDETHPRLFYIENHIPMEIAPWSVTVQSSSRRLISEQEVLVDLGAPCRVERITLLLRGSAANYRVFASPGWSRDKWQEAPVTAGAGFRCGSPPNPENASLNRRAGNGRLIALLAENRITHIVLGHHAGAEFLPEFFVRRRGVAELTPVASFGNYEVLAVRQ